MGAAFKQFFLTFTALFSATSKVAEALDILATSGVEMSQQHLDSARHERQIEALKLAAKVRELEASLTVDKPKSIKAA